MGPYSVNVRSIALGVSMALELRSTLLLTEIATTLFSLNHGLDKPTKPLW